MRRGESWGRGFPIPLPYSRPKNSEEVRLNRRWLERRCTVCDGTWLKHQDKCPHQPAECPKCEKRGYHDTRCPLRDPNDELRLP